MKKSIYYILFFLILLFHLNAEVNNSRNESRENKEQPHNLFFGPEFLYTHFRFEQGFLNESFDGFYDGLRVRYEYLKPRMFYFGTDLFASYGIEYLKIFNDDNIMLMQGKETSGFGNIDVRVGYPFINKATLVPFLGLGEYFTFKIGSGHVIHIDYFYISGGYRFSYKISSKFRIGQDSKFFRVIDGKLRDNFSTMRYNKTGFWGCEFSLPLIWFFAKSWSFQFEPYFLKLNLSSTENIFGGKLLFGYHF